MFFPPLCLEAVGSFYHKAPFVGRVKNAFEGNRIPIRSIFAVSTRGVNEFLNPDISWLDHGPRLLPGYLRSDTILIREKKGTEARREKRKERKSGHSTL